MDKAGSWFRWLLHTYALEYSLHQFLKGNIPARVSAKIPQTC